MNVFYLYNEILPKKKAHDLYIANECEALAALCSLTLVCGQGSSPSLFSQYNVNPFPIRRLPIVRKNNPLNFSWNWPFFRGCQQLIESQKPDAVLLSVRKQAAYHLKHKVPRVKYLYEVHELTTYPNTTPSKELDMEVELLSNADQITVTTPQLKDLLCKAPYMITTPIEVIPLASKFTPLPLPPEDTPFTLAYIGQLYKDQGIELLLEALEHVEDANLIVIGGKEEEIERLKNRCVGRVRWCGYQPPAKIPELARGTHAFVAPYLSVGRMPYVAHTKLVEYTAMRRPIIAPDSFEAGSASSLARAIEKVKAEQKCVHNGQVYTWEERADQILALL